MKLVSELAREFLKTTTYYGVRKLGKPLVYIAMGYGIFKGCESKIDDYFQENQKLYNSINQENYK